MTAVRGFRFPRLGDWTDFPGLRSVQNERLVEALRLAAGSAFHRHRLEAAGPMQTIEDLDRLPIMDKTDLRANYPFGLLAVERRRLATYHESSGTSGQPTSSYFTDSDWTDVVDRFCRNAVGLRETDTVLVRTPYALLTTGHQAHLAGRYRGATVVPADNRTAVVTHARVVRLLRDLGVTVAWCLPTEAILWAAAARAAGLRPESDFPQLRALVVAGEALGPARKAAISRLWGGVPVFQDYGSTETGSLAGECAAGELHLWADRFVPQVFDPSTGQADISGTGELLITTLYREGMPLLRYNLRDQVRISQDECPCGVVLPTVEVLGRDESSCRVGGLRVTQRQLEDAVYAGHGVLFWRARAGARLLVEIEAVDGPDPAPAVSAAIEATMGVQAEVRVVAPGTIVPSDALTREAEFVKPRSLFGAAEDWGRAVSYW